MTDPNNETEGRYFTRSAKKAKDSQVASNESTSRDYASTSQQLQSDQGHSSSTEQIGETLNCPPPEFFDETPSEIGEGDLSTETFVDDTQGHSRSDQQGGEPGFNSNLEAMAESSKVFGPDSFSGSSKEDLNKFLQTFELWSTFRRYDEPTKLSALPLLLKDSAYTWYSTLGPAVKNDYERLKAALLERYGPNQNQSWKNVADLWKMRQGDGQSFDDYVNKVEQEANRLKCPKETIFMVIMNGLRPIIRQMVTIQNPTTIDQLKRLGRLVEDSSQDATTDMHGTLSELRELAGQLKAVQLQAYQPQQDQQQSSTESYPPRPSNRPWSGDNRGRSFPSTRLRGNVPRGHGQPWGQQNSTNSSWSTGGRGHGQPRFRGQPNNSTRSGWSNNNSYRQRGFSNFRDLSAGFALGEYGIPIVVASAILVLLISLTVAVICVLMRRRKNRKYSLQEIMKKDAAVRLQPGGNRGLDGKPCACDSDDSGYDDVGRKPSASLKPKKHLPDPAVIKISRL